MKSEWKIQYFSNKRFLKKILIFNVSRNQKKDLADISKYNVPGSFVQAHWLSILGREETTLDMEFCIIYNTTLVFFYISNQ